MVKAANPTGLLPIWDKYVDQDVVDELGFTYDPSKAKKILADAGYKDVDGDEFVEAPDGSKIAAEDHRPERLDGLDGGDQDHRQERPGRGHQRSARLPGLRRVSGCALKRHVRYDASTTSPDEQHPLDVLSTGCSTIRSRISRPSQGGNYGRYDNQEAFDLVTQLDKVPVDDLEGMKAIISTASDDPAHRYAHDPAVVQRRVGAVQQCGLDELAVVG